MLEDLKKLGYRRRYILERIREKGGTFFWNPDYNIRDGKGRILKRLKIKDLRTGKYVDLRRYKERLKKYDQFRTSKGYLIANNYGWEVDIPFRKKERLLSLVNLFLKKSGDFIYDNSGTIIVERAKERRMRAPWPDSYRVPVLLLGESALKHSEELPDFDPAIKFSLIKNSNEISFVVHKYLEILRSLPHYETLIHLGFSEERCLGNRPFLNEVDQV